MSVSPYSPVRDHESKSDPHPQYLKSANVTQFALKSDLAIAVRKFAVPIVREIVPKVVGPIANQSKPVKGEKGDKGDKGDTGESGGGPHTHPISEVVNLQTTLDGKALSSHSHPISDVTNLQSSLDGKAASSHTHAQSAVTNLVSDLDGKAASVHTHAQSDVTGLVSALAGKANSSHTHPQSDVTNLTTDLAGKASTGHTHAGLPVMGRIPSDIAQSSNVTFSNLFTQAVLASEIWSFEAIIYFTSAAITTGLVAQCDSPASPTFGQCAMCVEETVTVGRYLPAAFNATMIGTAAVVSPAINVAWISGTLENGANNGNLVVKFRSEANGSAITVKRGSWCRFFKH